MHIFNAAIFRHGRTGVRGKARSLRIMPDWRFGGESQAGNIAVRKNGHTQHDVTIRIEAEATSLGVRPGGPATNRVAQGSVCGFCT
jgi:hypothetical protein